MGMPPHSRLNHKGTMFNNEDILQDMKSYKLTCIKFEM